jgi:hypothetical protein
MTTIGLRAPQRVSDDARQRISRLLGLARLPKIFDRRQADDSDATPRELVGHCDVEAGPAAVAGDDDRNPVCRRALGGDLDQRQIGDVFEAARCCYRQQQSMRGSGAASAWVRPSQKLPPPVSVSSGESVALRRPCNANGNGSHGFGKALTGMIR